MTPAPAVGVLDYGSGNLHSVCQALANLGARVVVSSRWPQLKVCDGLVLPGVGAFAACLAGLQACDGPATVANFVAAGRPLLGICVGHQVLFDEGLEHGRKTAGLGLLPGVVEQLPLRRLPHMGWDTVEPPASSAMFEGVRGDYFYFCHSYAVREMPSGWPTDGPGAAWCAQDGGRFVAAVEAGPIWSTQFHPEKSGAAGARLLANWLARVARFAGAG